MRCPAASPLRFFFPPGLCMRLLVYLLLHVRSRISGASLRCRRPLLAFHQGSGMAATRAGSVRYCGCVFAAAGCKPATPAIAACATVRNSASAAGTFPPGRSTVGDLCTPPDAVPDQPVSQSFCEHLASTRRDPKASAALSLNTQLRRNSRTLFFPCDHSTFSASRSRVLSARYACSSGYYCCSSPFCSPRAAERPIQTLRTDAEERAGGAGEAAAKRAERATAVTAVITAASSAKTGAATAEKVIQTVSIDAAVTKGERLSPQAPTALKHARVTLPGEGAPATTMEALPEAEAATAVMTTGMTSGKVGVAIGSNCHEEGSTIAIDLSSGADKPTASKISAATTRSHRKLSKSSQRQNNACAAFFWQQARLLCFNAVVSVFSSKNVTSMRRRIFCIKKKPKSPTNERNRRRQRKPARKVMTSLLRRNRRQRRQQNVQQHRKKKQQQQRPTRILTDTQGQAGGSISARTRYNVHNSRREKGREENEKRIATTVADTRSVTTGAAASKIPPASAAAAAGGSSCADTSLHIRPATMLLAEEGGAAAETQGEVEESAGLLRTADGKDNKQHQLGEIQKQMQRQVETHQETHSHHNASAHRPKDVQHREQQSKGSGRQRDRGNRSEQQIPQRIDFHQHSRIVGELHKKAIEREGMGKQPEEQYSVEEWKRQKERGQQHIRTVKQKNFLSEQQKEREKLNRHSEKRREGQQMRDRVLRGQHKQQELNRWHQVLRHAQHNERLSCRLSAKERKKTLKKVPPRRREDQAARRRHYAFACCSSHFAMLALHPQLLRQQQVRRLLDKELRPKLHVRLQEGERVHTPKLQQQQQHQQLHHERQRRLYRKRRSCSDDRLQGTEEVQSAGLSTINCSGEGVGSPDDSGKSKSAGLVSRSAPDASGIVAVSADARPLLQTGVVVPLPAMGNAFFSNLPALPRAAVSTAPNISREKHYIPGEERGQQVEDHTIERHVKRRLDKDYRCRTSPGQGTDAKAKCGNSVRGDVAQGTVAEEELTFLPRDVERNDRRTFDTGDRQSYKESGTSKDTHFKNREIGGEERIMYHSSVTETNEVEIGWRQPIQNDGEQLRIQFLFNAVGGADDVEAEIPRERKGTERGQQGSINEEVYARAEGELKATARESDENKMVQTVPLIAEKSPTRIWPQAEKDDENKDVRRKQQDGHGGVNDRAVSGRVAEQPPDERESQSLENETENVDRKRGSRQVTLGENCCLGGGDREQNISGGEKTFPYVEYRKNKNVSVRRIQDCSAKRMVRVVCREGCKHEAADSRAPVEGKKKLPISSKEGHEKKKESAQRDARGDNEERERNILYTGPQLGYVEQHADDRSDLTEIEVREGVWGHSFRKKGYRATCCIVEENDVENCPNTIADEEKNQTKAKEVLRLHQQVDKNAGRKRVLSRSAEGHCEKFGAAEKKLRASETMAEDSVPSASRKSGEIAASPREKEMRRKSLQNAAAQALAFARFIEETELRQGEGWAPLMRARKPRATTEASARPTILKSASRYCSMLSY